MRSRYKVQDKEGLFFMTFTIVGWVDFNPIESGFVSSPEDYLYSSARNYAGEIGVFEVDVLE